MKEIYTKRITRIPDSLPMRSEKGIEVDYTDGKVTDIYVVTEVGSKRIDLDGNVKDSYSKTITANGSVTIDNAEYGEEYTSVKEVAVEVEVPIEAAKIVDHNATGTTTVSVPVSTDYAGQGNVTVNITVTPIELTQDEYDALTVKDPNTIYLISD